MPHPLHQLTQARPGVATGLGEALQMPAQLANDLSRRGGKLARLFGQPQMLLCELR